MLAEKSPRIAHVAGYIGSRFGGEPRVVWALSRESARSGFDISVWATGTPADRADVESRGLAANVYRSGRPKQWFRSPSLVCDLSGVINEMDMLHLHSVWTHPLQAAARLACRAGVPYLLTAHGVLQPWRLQQKRLKKSLYLALIGKRMLSGAACLHATTSSEAEGFRRAGYQGPITVVPNGVDVPDYDVARLRAEADDFWPVFRNRRVVLFLSRFSPEKGLDLLLPVFRDLAMRPAYDDVILVLAGSGHRSCVKMVADLAAELGVADRVLMPGFVQGRQKAMVSAIKPVAVRYKNCDIKAL